MTTADPTGAALLRAVCLAPDDVAPRLVYADWLEQEDGQGERAEFIRVQCRIAAINAEVQSDEDCGRESCEACRERKPLLCLEDELIRFNATRWLWGTVPHEMLDGYGCWRHKGGRILPKRHNNGHFEFRRGFVEAVACTAEQWERHGPAVVLDQPVLSVRLVGKAPLCHQDRGPERRDWTWLEPSAAHRFPAHSKASLPQGIYDLCKGWYATEQAALDALSRACVTWARRKAGLDVRCRWCISPTGGEVSPLYGPCPDCKGAGWVAAR